jgi:hypothetical protein
MPANLVFQRPGLGAKNWKLLSLYVAAAASANEEDDDTEQLGAAVAGDDSFQLKY